MSKPQSGFKLASVDLVKKEADAAQMAADQCVKEGQKIAEEAIDKGCQAAKEAGEKAKGAVRSSFNMS